MHKFVSAGLAGSIALTVGSCSSNADKNVVITLPPEPFSTAEAPATEQPFDAKTAPLVPQVAAPEYIPGLIQATNGDERARQVQRGIDSQKRSDPFASLPLERQQPSTDTYRPSAPPIRRSPTQTKRIPRLIQQRPTIAYRPNFPFSRQFPVKPDVTVPPLTPRTRITAVKPKRTTPLLPNQSTPFVRTLPPLPSANLANAVEVSGVVVVGSVVHAIVKAPNEANSRHIRVGQRLSDGQVLVKRIELNARTEPVVIFEENGVEVSRAIGESGTFPSAIL
ncbi:MAG: hypothetical protein KME42_01480 [Tildeniella nuda ZEHNDER 1965/U140]|jgi:hypothetical protein|nr:hypothetical protein [Tildeniella nuda ZEHNDER 1965/U140]